MDELHRLDVLNQRVAHDRGLPSAFKTTAATDAPPPGSKMAATLATREPAPTTLNDNSQFQDSLTDKGIFPPVSSAATTSPTSTDSRFIKPSQIPETSSSHYSGRILTAPCSTARIVSMPETTAEPKNTPNNNDNTRLHRSFDMVETADLSLYSDFSDKTGLELDRSQRVHITPRSERHETFQTPSTPSSPDSVIFIHHNKSQQLSESFLRKGEYDGEGWITIEHQSSPKPIPALHGPASLPYARCPSGAEGTVIENPLDVQHVIWGLDAKQQHTGHASAPIRSERTRANIQVNIASGVPGSGVTMNIQGSRNHPQARETKPHAVSLSRQSNIAQTPTAPRHHGCSSSTHTRHLATVFTAATEHLLMDVKWTRTFQPVASHYSTGSLRQPPPTTLDTHDARFYPRSTGLGIRYPFADVLLQQRHPTHSRQGDYLSTTHSRYQAQPLVPSRMPSLAYDPLPPIILGPPMGYRTVGTTPSLNSAYSTPTLTPNLETPSHSPGVIDITAHYPFAREVRSNSLSKAFTPSESPNSANRTSTLILPAMGDSIIVEDPVAHFTRLSSITETERPEPDLGKFQTRSVSDPLSKPASHASTGSAFSRHDTKLACRNRVSSFPDDVYSKAPLPKQSFLSKSANSSNTNDTSVPPTSRQSLYSKPRIPVSAARATYDLGASPLKPPQVSASVNHHSPEIGLPTTGTKQPTSLLTAVDLPQPPGQISPVFTLSTFQSQDPAVDNGRPATSGYKPYNIPRSVPFARMIERRLASVPEEGSETQLPLTVPALPATETDLGGSAAASPKAPLSISSTPRQFRARGPSLSNPKGFLSRVRTVPQSITPKPTISPPSPAPEGVTLLAHRSEVNGASQPSEATPEECRVNGNPRKTRRSRRTQITRKQPEPKAGGATTGHIKSAQSAQIVENVKSLSNLSRKSKGALLAVTEGEKENVIATPTSTSGQTNKRASGRKGALRTPRRRVAKAKPSPTA